MITKEVAVVYCAKTKGRRYFSKAAAIHAETMAIIRKKYPTEEFECDTGYSFDCTGMDGFEKIYRRMWKLVAKSLTNNINKGEITCQ